MPKPVDNRDLGWSEKLPRATYIARVSENPFADRTGIEPEIARGEHVLLGVLEHSEDAERAAVEEDQR